MKAAVLERPGEFRIVDSPEPPPPGEGEALVEIRRVGICGTDLHAYAGRQPFFTYPRILGHELGAVVLSRGWGVENVAPGDRVAVEPYLTCGVCPPCKAGRYNCCVQLRCLGVHADGGMRERVVLPVRLLHRSDRLSLDQLALVETLGIGAHAVERAHLEADEWTAVIGVGPIGIGVVQMALSQGARVIAVDLHPGRLAFVADLGVDYAVDASRVDTAEALAEITGGEMPSCVFDATGSPRSMEASLELARSGGRVVFVGLATARISFDDPSFHRRELTILASRNSNGAFPYLIRLLEERAVDVRPWITHRLPLENVGTVFPILQDPANGAVKALIELED